MFGSPTGERRAPRHILVATGARPVAAARDRGPRARHHLQRGLRPRDLSQPAARRRRRLYRGRVRLAVPPARRRRDRGHARRQRSARLRRGHARRACATKWRAPAWSFGSAACRRGSKSAARGSMSTSPTARRSRSIRFSSPPAARRTPRGSGWKRPASRSTPRARSSSMRASTTNIPSIHAVGDVTDRINLTPVAIREGHRARRPSVRRRRRARRSRQRRDARSSPPRRSARSASPRPRRASATRRRHLQDQLPADEGDAHRAARSARS